MGEKQALIRQNHAVCFRRITFYSTKNNPVLSQLMVIITKGPIFQFESSFVKYPSNGAFTIKKTKECGTLFSPIFQNSSCSQDLL